MSGGQTGGEISARRETKSGAPIGKTLDEGGGFGWGVVGLLALAVFLNYVDRGNLATAAPVMKQELKLSAAQLGLLIAAFSWTYTPCQLLAGWLIERINPYRTLALGLGLWSLATAATGFVGGFASLIALRLVLGLGESAAFPASSTLLARHLAPQQLGRANGLVSMGISLGPAFGTFAGGLLIAKFGWRDVFIVFGGISLLWLGPWLVRTRRASANQRQEAWAPGPAYRTILRQRAAWGAGLGHFCANYGAYFILSWLPYYLVKARGYSVAHMAQTGGLIYLAYAMTIVGTGMTTDFFMARGISANRVRKTAAVMSHTVLATGLLICALAPAAAIPALFLCALGMGFNGGGNFAIGQTLAGPRAAPRWIGLQNLCGNVAGMVGPAVTGWLIDSTGSFLAPFILTGLVTLLGAVAWGVIIPRIEPLDWGFGVPSSPLRAT